VARLAQLKGHEVLIPAFAEAVNYAKVDLELRLLGNGPFRQKLEELARACCVETRVRFLGESWDVAAQLRELDLFVLASLREGRPTSIMEAMASGLPVIATRVGAVPDLVVDGESGLLIDPSNVSGLANSILTLAHDPKRRRRFGDAARKIAVEQLQIWRMVAGYEHFYKEMAA
jgi:glycosyltransferase involved in cell wall biosynthesis